MREAAFVKQNKEKWLGIEHVISGKLKKVFAIELSSFSFV